MITTKTGDLGQTTCGNKRVDKDGLLVEVVGSVDELQSVLAIAKTRCQISDIRYQIEQIQKDLMMRNGELACGGRRFQMSDVRSQIKKRIRFFENEIERIEKELPELREFVIPGKNESEAFLHLARTVCRRVERRVVSLNKITIINLDILKYFNRLSDYLFIISRTV